MYNVKSCKADEFINHEEILETLDYAQANKNNRVLIEQLIDRAALCKGLTHREAAVLLCCDQPDLINRIYHLAKEVKNKFGYLINVVMRSDEKKQEFKPISKRWIIERTFSWLDNDRRLCGNYELLMENSENMVNYL